MPFFISTEPKNVVECGQSVRLCLYLTNKVDCIVTWASDRIFELFLFYVIYLIYMIIESENPPKVKSTLRLVWNSLSSAMTFLLI